MQPPVNIHWDTKRQQIILAAFERPWTWDDFHAAVECIHAMIASVPHTVHVIIWHKTHMPPGNPITHFNRTLKDRPDNAGQIVIITPQASGPLDRLIKTVSDVIRHIYADQSGSIIVVNTIDEARAVLAHKLKT